MTSTQFRDEYARLLVAFPTNPQIKGAYIRAWFTHFKHQSSEWLRELIDHMIETNNPSFVDAMKAKQTPSALPLGDFVFPPNK